MKFASHKLDSLEFIAGLGQLCETVFHRLDGGYVQFVLAVLMFGFMPRCGLGVLLGPSLLKSWRTIE